jgi:hypothetical protein
MRAEKRGLNLFLFIILIGLNGCGSITGLPGHGGGKRFAIEQEMISLATSQAIRGMELAPLSGKTVKLVFNFINDEGSGELSGGRFSLEGALRGFYTTSRTANGYTNRGNPHDNSDYYLNSYNQYINSYGLDGVGGIFKGQTSVYGYASGSDKDYVKNLMITEFLKKGVRVKGFGEDRESAEMQAERACMNVSDGPSQKMKDCIDNYAKNQDSNSNNDTTLIINIRIFGLIRDRLDLMIVNRERFIVRFLIDGVHVNDSGDIINIFKESGVSVNYAESYVLWNGPVNVNKSYSDYTGDFVKE